MTDLLIVNSIGPGFTLSSCTKGIGGSELEMAQVAHALAKRGMKVTIANGVTEEVEEDGVKYIPFAKAEGMRVRSLWIERMTVPPRIAAQRVVIRATDIYCPPYDVHKPLLESGTAAVISNTKWANEGFSFAKEKIIIPPVLDYDIGPGAPKKIPGLFVFASMPMKGLAVTLNLWRELKRKHGKVLRKAKLELVLPGQYDFYGDAALQLTDEDKTFGVSYVKTSSLAEYRRKIATAEGLFYVNRMPETFCCAAAFAEAFGTRTHILCLNGKAGIPEALVNSSLVTESKEQFEQDFMTTWQAGKTPLRDITHNAPDLSPGALAPLWEKALEPAAPSSVESTMRQEDLPGNKKPFSAAFGGHLSLLKESISVGGSEMGLGLLLQSLVAATRAKTVVEIGRFRGLSTLALASGLALIDEGWQEPSFARQRPDVDYGKLLDKAKRMVFSIDPHPQVVAEELLARADLKNYVTLVNKKSDDVRPGEFGPIDVLLIDGEHTVAAMRKDIARYVPHVRSGGYFILHDYFGWYVGDENRSPIKTAIDEDLEGFERVLIDTGFASFVIFRKMAELKPQPAKVAPRADGRPTVGLVLIAMGSEAATVVPRAIISAWKMVDAVTVVIDPKDGGEQTADVARHIGADVYLRPTPAHDFEKGIGGIAGARNEAVAIAERKTDYVLMLDADDTLEGELPKELDRDVYELLVHDGGQVYPRVQMWRSDKTFRYQDIIHEHLVCQGTAGRLTELKYIRRFGGGHQDSVPKAVKYTRHARLAAKWLADHPDDSRMQFYLAQSYRDAGRGDDAIREYERRIEMKDGMEEERAFSAFQIARIIREQGKDPTAAFLRAYEMRPTRAEPLVELSVWLRTDSRNRFALGVMVAKLASELPQPTDALFLEPSVYQFRALDEYAIQAYWSGDRKASLNAYEQLRNRAPDWYKGHIENMIAMLNRGQ